MSGCGAVGCARVAKVSGYHTSWETQRCASRKVEYSQLASWHFFLPHFLLARKWGTSSGGLV